MYKRDCGFPALLVGLVCGIPNPAGRLKRTIPHLHNPPLLISAHIPVRVSLRLLQSRKSLMSYVPYEQLVAPARRKPQIWRLVVGLVLCTVLYLFGIIALGEAISFLLKIPAWSFEMLLSTGNPTATLVMLFSFVMMALPPMLIVRWLHKRPGLTLIGDLRLTVLYFFRVTFALILLQIVLEILPPYDPFEVVANLSFRHWMALLPLSVLGIVIQTSAEEILFRGYIQSQLAARFNSRIIWMGVPSFLFALGHFDTATLGDNAIWATLWAGMFGLMAADLTARSGNLGAAIGFHFTNNAYAMLIVGFPDQLGGLALYHLPYSASDIEAASPLIMLDFGFLIVAWLAARIAIRR